jgi:hypothetical protein
VFTQDFFKPSIQLEEDIQVHLPKTSSVEGSSVPAPGTLSGENGLAPVSEASPRALAGPIEQSPGPEGEVAAVVGPPSPEADW